ncbi:MAG: sugar phosphate isomerase/epimerase [Eubacteriales bacterium]|nr:sugar phosphate isomerase/epimerase [Eubacteriales bacterium]
MIRLGVNSVLFKAVSFPEAARAIKMAGYDGVEISAIKGMCEHLNLERYPEQKNEIKEVLAETGLELLASEVASTDADRLELAFTVAADLGIPVINVGPGGKMNEPGSLEETIDRLARLAERAQAYGVTLCCKAHVGAAMFNTETTLKAMAAIANPAFGIDMDPSHVYRAGENPELALPQVLARTRHIHIRDCRGRGPSPGEPPLQACGRGDIDLFAYCKAMVDGEYDGPVDLEIIGPEQSFTQAVVIAAESYGYINACLKQLNAR